MEDTTWKCEPRKSLALVRGLTMRLLALVLLALVLVVLVLTLLGGCQQTRSTGGVTRSSAVPDFVQVGKSYEFWIGMAAPRVRVLEIRPDGWIRVERRTGEVVWFNVNQLIAIEEVGPASQRGEGQ
jgi:hypothetical protein